MNDQQRRAASITLLGEALNRKVTEFTLAAYELGLSDIDGESIEEAAKTAIRSCKFMPSVHELREIVAENRAKLAKKEIPQEIMRSRIVREMCRRRNCRPDELTDDEIEAAYNTLSLRKAGVPNVEFKKP